MTLIVLNAKGMCLWVKQGRRFFFFYFFLFFFLFLTSIYRYTKFGGNFRNGENWASNNALILSAHSNIIAMAQLQGDNVCAGCSEKTAHSLPVCLQKVNQAPTACKECYYFTILASDSGYGMDLVSYPSEKSQTLTTSDMGWRVPVSQNGSPLPFPWEISTSGKLMAYSRGQHTIACRLNLAQHLVIYSPKAKNGFYTFKRLEKKFFLIIFCDTWELYKNQIPVTL